MKLRVRGNSIRLRLSRGEVDALRATGAVEEKVALSPTPLVYRIERTAAAQRTSAHFDGARLVVEVPDAIARDFYETDRVGFEETHGEMRILVEKDWQCLAPRDEDESDAFPHPNAK